LTTEESTDLLAMFISADRFTRGSQCCAPSGTRTTPHHQASALTPMCRWKSFPLKILHKIWK
jgi:hypothetical protein